MNTTAWRSETKICLWIIVLWTNTSLFYLNVLLDFRFIFPLVSPVPSARPPPPVAVCIAVLQCRPWERAQVEASLLGLRRTPRSYWSPPPFCPPHSTGGGYLSHSRRYYIASSHPPTLGGTKVAFWPCVRGDGIDFGVTLVTPRWGTESTFNVAFVSTASRAHNNETFIDW